MTDEVAADGIEFLVWAVVLQMLHYGVFRADYELRNGNPIMIDPSVLQNAGRDQRVFYGTAGVVSFLFIFWLIGFIIMIVLCSARGTEGPNRYGPDPNAV